MILELLPFRRCGPLVRGMPRAMAAAGLDLPVEPFRKSPLSGSDALSVDGGRLHLHFDDAGGLEGVEAFVGQDVEIAFGGDNLLRGDSAGLIAALDRAGQTWRVGSYGISCPDLGIAAFHPEFDWAAGDLRIDAFYASLDPGFVPGD